MDPSSGLAPWPRPQDGLRSTPQAVARARSYAPRRYVGCYYQVSTVGPPLAHRPRLTELVVDRLLTLMRSGEFKEGSKLPPERELAEMLAVSRTIVREAMSALQLSGLVERRPGIGTVVTRQLAANVGLDDYVEASVSIAELIEARMALELGIVHLLCEQRDFNFVEVIATLDRMNLAVREDLSPENYILPSLEFHLSVARATEQPVVIAIQENLLDLMRPHLWLLIERYNLALAQQSLALHERMFAALQARDIIGALAEVKSHYMPYPVLTITGATTLSLADEGAS